MKCMRLVFKTEVLIYKSKAKLNAKISFRNITHLIDPEIRKMLERELYVKKFPY